MALKSFRQHFKIREEPTPIVRLNKLLLLLVFAGLSFLLSMAIIFALQNSVKPKALRLAQKVLSEKSSSPKIISDLIKEVPDQYGDAEKIKQYQRQALSPEVISRSSSLEKELNYLKEQQVELQQKVAALTISKVKRDDEKERPECGEAKNSLLFFANMSPKEEQTTTNASQEIYDSDKITTPISPFEVQAGTIIPSVLITGVNTSLAGDAVAKVRQDIYDTITGKYLLIPKGSKLLGAYDAQISYGQRRVLIVFNRIIRPDGTSILLTKLASTDLQGASGIPGIADNHWMKIFGAATLSSFLSVGVGAVADNNAIANVYYPTAKQGAILGVANSIAETGKALVNRNINIQPTVTIPAGFHFNIIVQKDLVLTPYRDQTSLPILGE